MFEERLIPLPTDVFRLIRDYIHEYCGIFFDERSKYLLERRLNRRLVVNHLKDFREYYRLLMYDRARNRELQTIIDILTVNETYFFREQNQFAAFSEEIVKELQERNKDNKRMRIWSAGCSTGEEPYTVAMYVLEDESLNGWDVDIVGSDISQRVLTVAREGIYKKNSFRATHKYFIKKYFHEHPKGDFKVTDNVRKLVTFNFLNLFDPYKVKMIGKVDVIFCRNVLIYFDLIARKRVIEHFFDILKDGGYLLLGHTESLINLSADFELKHLKNDMVYQKPKKDHSKGIFQKG